jgi:hypothetical protein
MGAFMRRTAVAITTLVVAVSVLGACGSSKSSGAPGTAATTAAPGSAGSTTAPASSTPTQPEVSPQGDISDSAVYVAQTDPGGKYTVKVPEGWAMTTSGTAVSFTDKLNTIRVETAPAAAAPTIASATATEVPKIALAASQYKAGRVSMVSRTSGPAVLITYEETSTPNPVTGKTIRLAVERYEFWAHGTEAIVTLSGPVGADNVDPWKIVTDSFTWK